MTTVPVTLFKLAMLRLSARYFCHRRFYAKSKHTNKLLKLNVRSRNQVESTVCSIFFISKREINVDSDYAKFSDPGLVENFFERATNTSWIQYVEKYFITLHDVTGLHWCSSIVLSTVILRILVTLPIYINQVKSNVKYQMYLPMFTTLYKKLAEEVDEAAKKNNWDKKTAKQHFVSNLYVHRKKMKKQYKIPGIGKRYMLPFVQIPLWISVSISLRHLAGSLPINTLPTSDLEAIGLQLSEEGCLWFSNLCLIDSYYIMPIALGIINLSIIEIYRGDGKTKPIGLQKYMLNFSRALSVILIPIACQMPAAVVLYWFSSSLYGASQALIFRSHKIKDLFRIPYPKNESRTPYKDLFRRLSFRRHRNDNEN